MNGELSMMENLEP